MKNLIEIKNLITKTNLISFSTTENFTLTKNDFSIYVDNSKISINEFSLENSDKNYTLTISPTITLTGTLHFFISTITHFSGIIYIYYDIGLLEFNPTMSFLELIVPSELESYTYNLSFLTFDNKSLTSPPIPLTICNGISSTSSIELYSSTANDKTFEIILFDDTRNPAPDGDYIVEIMIGE